MSINIQKVENGYVVTVPYGRQYIFKDFQEMIEFIAHEVNYLKIGECFEGFKVMI